MPWHLLKSLRVRISSLGSMRSIIPVILIAVPNLSAPSRRWPTWQRRQPLKVISSCVSIPLIQLTKAQIIQRGTELGDGLTHSCYDPSPDGASCGQCDSCVLRLKGFAEAGVADPITYRAPPSLAR